MKRFTQVIVYIGVGFLISCFALTVIYGYDSVMTSVLKAIGHADKADRILALLTPSKFKMIQIALFLLSLAGGVLIYYFDRLWNLFVACLSYLKECFKFLLNQLITTPVKWVLIIPFLSSVYFALTMPVSYDEAYTYLQFTTRFPVASLFYYPLPNNHVLHSLITNFTHYIPFCSDLFCLRISNIGFSFISWLICFSFLKKYYSINFSLIVTSITSMMFMSVYYSYMSRGYGLVLMFFIISLYAAFNIIQVQNVKRNWIVFSLSSILGFFTIPSYLYAWIILNAIIFLNSKQQIKNLFVYNISVVCLVLCLYTPIILVNGVDALIGNRFVLPISRTEVFNRLPVYFLESIFEITGLHTFFVLVLLGISVVLVLKSKNHFERIFTVIFLVSPAALLIGHSVIPFARTFNYYAFVLVFLILLPYQKKVSEYPVIYVVVVSIILQSFLLVNFCLKINTYESFNVANHELNKKIVGKSKYYFNSEFFEMDFLFENQIRGFHVDKAYYSIPQKVDRDTLSGFDYYIIDKKNDCTKKHKPAYSNTNINVYGN